MRHRHIIHLTGLVLLASVASFTKAQQDPNVNVWVVSPLKKVLHDRFAPPDTGSIDLIAAKNEYESAQVAIRSFISNATVTASCKIQHEQNDFFITPQIRFAGYITFKRNSPSSKENFLIARPGQKVPDVLYPQDSIKLEQYRTQTLWLTFYVPADAPQGRYNGQLQLSWNGGSRNVPIRLTVYEFAIPEKCNLDVARWVWNWGDFDSSSAAYKGIRADLQRLYGIKPLSDEYWGYYEKMLVNMRRHRQNVLWLDTGLIERIVDDANRLICKFDQFDRMLALTEKVGFDLYELPAVAEGGWSVKEFTLWPLKAKNVSGHDVKLSAEQYLIPYLEQLNTHLKDRGILSKVITHVGDEPVQHTKESWRKLSRMVRQAMPAVPRIEAVIAAGFDDDLEILVPKLNHLNDWFQDYRQAQQAGKELWFYNCGQPYAGYYPTTFIDSPAIDMRLLHWLNWKSQTTGYLHWGFAVWTEKPFDDCEWRNNPPGESFIVYPGQKEPLDSIRHELDRESIEDYECFYLLRTQMERVKSQLGAAAADMDPNEPSDAVCTRMVIGLADVSRDIKLFESARKQLYDEIAAANQEPLLMLRLSPPASRRLSPGSAWVMVHGVVEPGTAVEINGKTYDVVSDGKFVAQLPDFGEPGSTTVTITVRKGDKIKTVSRYYEILPTIYSGEAPPL